MDDIFSITDNGVYYERLDEVQLAYINPEYILRQFQKERDISYDENTVIQRCRKQRIEGFVSMIVCGTVVCGLGMAFSARKREIAITALLAIYVGYTSANSTHKQCLLGLCQLPSSEMGAELRNRIFKQMKDSNQARFLREMGYDEKNLVNPTITAVPSIRENTVHMLFIEMAKTVTVDTSTARKDQDVSVNLNRMTKYFRTEKPEVMKLDDITMISYRDSTKLVGSSFHIKGSMKDVITMMRRVNTGFGLLSLYKQGRFVKFESRINSKDKEYTGEIIVMMKEGVELGMVSQQGTVQGGSEKRKEEEKREMEMEMEMKKREEEEEDNRYHGSSMNPHLDEKEDNRYHGSSMNPHLDEKEDNRYHGSSMNPHRDDDDNDDRYDMVGDNSYEETIKPNKLDEPSDFLNRYLSNSLSTTDSAMNDFSNEERPKDLVYKARSKRDKRRPEKPTNWDTIRRQSFIVC